MPRQIEAEQNGGDDFIDDFKEDASAKFGPGQTPHRCTDAGFCVVMLLLVGAQGYIAYSSIASFREISNPRIIDWQNKEECGLGANENRTLAYWCFDKKLLFQKLKLSGHNSNLSNADAWGTSFSRSWNNPICVETCPDSWETRSWCYNIFGFLEGDPSDTTEVEINNYPSENYSGLCVPRDQQSFATRMIQNVDSLSVKQHNQTNNKIGNKLLMELSTSNIYRAWWVIAGAGALSTATAWAYLHFLDYCAGPVVKVCAQLSVIVPLATGAYFINAYNNGGSMLSQGLLGGASDLGLGISLVTAGIILLCFVCKGWRSLQTAVAIVQAGCECVFDERTLMLEPFLSASCRVAALMVALPGACCLVLSGSLDGFHSQLAMWTFTYSTEQWAQIIFYSWMTWWAIEYINSSSQYVLAWVAKSWYFTPYRDGCKYGTPGCAIFQGILNLMMYHTGTIALGSCLISFLRPVRLVVHVLSDAATAGNAVTGCLCSICCCAAQSCEHYLLLVSKNTYIDVAIYSTPFHEAAKNASIMVSGYFRNIFMLNGVQFIFQIGGVAVSTFVATSFAYLTLLVFPEFNDVTGPSFINDSCPVVYSATAVGFAIGCAYMVVFDIVTDTMFYCYVIDEYYLAQEEVKFRERWDCLPTWLFWDDEDDVFEDVPARHVYAPYELREFMLAHGKHAAAANESESDKDGV